MEGMLRFNALMGVLSAVCCGYLLVYMAVGLFGHERKGRDGAPETAPTNRYAVLICARNEEAVIGRLLQSLASQTYPQSLVSVFVMADNCTDGTARAAREEGARVYERCDTAHVGKGWALDALMRHIRRDHPEGFDGYLVFDADNILRADYLEEMDKTFREGYSVVTGYRNSLNGGGNWVAAGSALWFMRENRFLNLARQRLGISCMVGGTGFLFSRSVAEEMGGWPYHLLTEDKEFTADMLIRGHRIGFCAKAELFDEQPESLPQALRQRMRWARGYLQVFGRYGCRLAAGIGHGSFACYDLVMSVVPAFLLPAVMIAVNAAALTGGILTGADLRPLLSSFGTAAVRAYLGMMAVGALTTAAEWRRIGAGNIRKLCGILTFPVFLLCCVPAGAAAVFARVEWKPIRHGVAARGVPARIRRQG